MTEESDNFVPAGKESARSANPVTISVLQPGNEPNTVISARYELVEKIGEGGMGEVWVAKQTAPVKRKVALKLIKKGMDSKAVLARFEQERQALAMMDHPNIARVLDGGMTSAGQPYFVMELVNGESLIKFCDAARLNPRERLELFIPICQSVQHAHQKGIVHRDLKPANILVTMIDGKAVPKVIDFGVAKATAGKLTDDSLATQFGSVVGTLEYMSPEQAGFSGQDIDTRADIYSLGVILYELLTGLRPYDGGRLKKAALLEMIRIIREEEPSKPSTRLSTDASFRSRAAVRQTEPRRLMAMLRGELDWVVMKCLEKSRDRRYESANGLARDIQRYLANEPVEARPPSTGYRLAKFLQRNKGAVVAASLVLFALAAGIVGTTLGMFEAKRQELLARGEMIEKEKARQAAAEQRSAAETQKEKALQAAAAEKTANETAQKRLKQIEKANEILGSIFENLDPKEIVKNKRPLQAILVEKLDKAAEQLDGESIGDPTVVGVMQTKIGLSLIGLGEPGKAIPLLAKARAAREAKSGLDDPMTWRTVSNLATAYQFAGKWEQALPLFEETLKFQKAKLGPDHPETLKTMNNLAVAHGAAGKKDLSLVLHEETLKLKKTKLGLEHPDTLFSMNNLAVGYLAEGKVNLALPLFEEALKGRKSKLGSEHPDTLQSMSGLALAYRKTGQTDLAHSLFEQTLKIRRVKLGPEHPDTLRSMCELAESYWLKKQLDKSIPLFEEALRGRVAKLGRDHLDTLSIRFDLGVNYKDAGRIAEAIPMLEEVHRGSKKYPLLLPVAVPLRDCYVLTGKTEQASALTNELLSDSGVPYPEGGRKRAGELLLLGLTPLQAKRYAEAEPHLRECLALNEKIQPDLWTTFSVKSMLGGALLGQKKYAEAEPLLLASYAGLKKRKTKMPPQYDIVFSEALDRLVELYSALNKPAEAQKWQAERAKFP